MTHEEAVKELWEQQLHKANDWWKWLRITEKERIGSKIASHEEGRPMEVKYPEVTVYWQHLDPGRQIWIYEHCKERHDLEELDWTEGASMSY